jgi:hypothetical protein
VYTWDVALTATERAAVLADGFQDLGYRTKVMPHNGRVEVFVFGRTGKPTLAALSVDAAGKTYVVEEREDGFLARTMKNMRLPSPERPDIEALLPRWERAGDTLKAVGASDVERQEMVNEVRMQLGSRAKFADIREFYVEGGEPEMDSADIARSGLDYPPGITEGQQRKLWAAWLTGVSKRMATLVEEDIKRRAAARVIHEGPEGMLGEGWWVLATRRGSEGGSRHASSREEALRIATQIERDDEDWDYWERPGFER